MANPMIPFKKSVEKYVSAIFDQIQDFRPFQLRKYTVCDEESDVQVKNSNHLEAEWKNKKNPN